MFLIFFYNLISMHYLLSGFITRVILTSWNKFDSILPPDFFFKINFVYVWHFFILNVLCNFIICQRNHSGLDCVSLCVHLINLKCWFNREVFKYSLSFWVTFGKFCYVRNFSILSKLFDYYIKYLLYCFLIFILSAGSVVISPFENLLSVVSVFYCHFSVSLIHVHVY